MTRQILLQALIDRVAEAVPEARHYRGRLEEGFFRPAFLYVPVYFGEKKRNYVTSEKNVEVQMVYFGKTDNYGREDFAERLQVQEKLDGFLSQFYLTAGDRKLHFTYEEKDTDGQMTYYLTFRFLDEAFDQRMLAEEAMEAAESLRMGTEVTGK